MAFLASHTNRGKRIYYDLENPYQGKVQQPILICFFNRWKNSISA